MKTERITPAELLRELRDMALLEAKATNNRTARIVWRDVFNWAEATAERNRITIPFLPGAAGPETANDRRPSAGATRKGARTRTGAPGTPSTK
jgi:hypothetical protein